MHSSCVCSDILRGESNVFPRTGGSVLHVPSGIHIWSSHSFFLFVLFGCMRAELLYLLKPVVTQRDLLNIYFPLPIQDWKCLYWHDHKYTTWLNMSGHTCLYIFDVSWFGLGHFNPGSRALNHRLHFQFFRWFMKCLMMIQDVLFTFSWRNNEPISCLAMIKNQVVIFLPSTSIGLSASFTW